MTIIQLPEPVITGGMPIMDALNKRSSCKNIDSKLLSNEQLSNLLWAAFGINRKDSGKRTAPSARNIQEMLVYVIMSDGAYLYKPEEHILELASTADLRQKSALQPNFFDAPVHLVFVADYSQQEIPVEKMDRYNHFSHAHAGLIGQNVNLFCISEGLGACFVATYDKKGLTEALKLTEDQEVIYTQMIGYPVA